MRRLLFVVLAALFSSAIAAALAQHSHHPAQGHGAGPAPRTPPADTREFVRFPQPLVEHTLANMRDHLLALQEIQEHLGMGHPDVAARIAETRLGMSALGQHGAHEVAPYMPEGMRAAGTAMHRAASQFAITATDSAVTGDTRAVFTGLATITAACVACHAGYRLK